MAPVRIPKGPSGAAIYEYALGESPGGGEGVPAGTIALWSPLNGAVPSGWVECDGVANAPGPDLRDRFVVGRGPSHTVDGTGGASTHTHAGHAAHTVTQPAAHTVTQPDAHTTVAAHSHSHAHTQRYFPTTTGGSVGHVGDTSMSGTQTNETLTTTTDATSSGSASVAHAGTAVDAHVGTAVDGHSAHDNPNSEPTWYALIYIQKT